MLYIYYIQTTKKAKICTFVGESARPRICILNNFTGEAKTSCFANITL